MFYSVGKLAFQPFFVKRGSPPHNRRHDTFRQEIRMPSSRVILRSQYFIYFGILGLYLPYFNLYCYHLGFNGSQIGMLAGLRSATLVLFPFVWGALADRFRRRKSIYLLCNALACVSWAGYLYTTDFTPMLVLAIVHGMFYAPLISFLEAYAMDLLGEDKNTYGRVRVWGSVSFILIVTVLGHVSERYGIAVIVPLILAGALLQTTAAVALPAAPVVRPLVTKSAPIRINWPRTLVFLCCGFLMLVSHGTYYGFFSIHLENLGLPPTYIGIAWAMAVLAEIIVMINSRRLFSRASFESVLLASFLIAALRWLLLAAFTSPVVILGSQILHAFSYGTFHMASILYMDRLTPGPAKTLGQAANNAITYGLGLMIGFMVSGALFDQLGARPLFVMSAGLALAGGILFRWHQQSLPGPMDESL
jgi:PPP family 3-phenylpropionic acid transporter